MTGILLITECWQPLVQLKVVDQKQVWDLMADRMSKSVMPFLAPQVVWVNRNCGHPVDCTTVNFEYHMTDRLGLNQASGLARGVCWSLLCAKCFPLFNAWPIAFPSLVWKRFSSGSGG